MSFGSGIAVAIRALGGAEVGDFVGEGVGSGSGVPTGTGAALVGAEVGDIVGEGVGSGSGVPTGTGAPLVGAETGDIVGEGVGGCLGAPGLTGALVVGFGDAKYSLLMTFGGSVQATSGAGKRMSGGVGPGGAVRIGSTLVGLLVDGGK
jgi:hypothetical protein